MPAQPGVRIERDEFPTQTHPGYHQPQAPGAVPPTYQPIPVNYGNYSRISHRSKVVAGVLGLLLGGLGIHRFYLGYTGIGLIQLLLSCTGISWIWGLVEGIIILTGGMQDVDGRDLRD
ncbi:MAG: TM2 domain-containing protein [Phycisphaerales bacterium]|nr:TM2 domain-containing protein [Phycisphaerales bacterium]